MKELYKLRHLSTRKALLMRGYILQGQASAVAFLGLQGQAGKGLFLASGICGHIFWQRTLAIKLGFLLFLTTPLKNDLMELEKIQGRRSDKGKGVTSRRRYIEEIRILMHRKIKTERP